MKDVRDRTAFITGGASGIGLGMAHAFVAAGMKVVLADLRQDHIDSALAGFERRGQRASVHAIRLDVTDRAAMAAAAVEVERVFGKLHVLANNAGVGIQGPFRGVTFADWDFGLAVNLGGVINGLQTFLPRLRAHGEGGHVINTASLAALVPMPAQFVIYQTAKAAVVTLSEGIRGELAQERIGVSVLCPVPCVPTSMSCRATGRHGSASATPSAPRERRRHAGGIPSQLEPDAVGERVLQAIRNDELYIITHGEWKQAAAQRHAAVLAAMPEKLDPAS